MENYDPSEDLKHLESLKNKDEILSFLNDMEIRIWTGPMSSLIEKIGASSKTLDISYAKHIPENINVIAFRCNEGIRVFMRDNRKGFVLGNPFGPAEITFAFNDHDSKITSICYFLNGEAIRDDLTKPAFISHRGYIEWTNEKGQWHRIGGPALISPHQFSWYENHKFIRKEMR